MTDTKDILAKTAEGVYSEGALPSLAQLIPSNEYKDTKPLREAFDKSIRFLFFNDTDIDDSTLQMDVRPVFNDDGSVDVEITLKNKESQDASS